MSDGVDQFVADLAVARIPSLVNQYAVEVAGLDRQDAAAIRRSNLAAYLDGRLGAKFALIGEAPSAHGGRFSGIAFTDERSLEPQARSSAIGLAPDGFREYSAGILRKALQEADIDIADVVLWNAVPFHPARPDNPLRNRRPSVEEIGLSKPWIDRFVALMRPGCVVAVGRTAARALGPWAPMVRHPAYGGQQRLIEDLIRLSTGEGAQHPRSLTSQGR